MTDPRAELTAAATHYCETRDAHARARKRIEKAIAEAVAADVPRMEIYDLVSDAISARRARQLVDKQGLEPGHPFGRKPKSQTQAGVTHVEDE